MFLRNVGNQTQRRSVTSLKSAVLKCTAVRASELSKPKF